MRHGRLRKHESFDLPFVKESQVSFTKNRAERDLRISKSETKGIGI